MRRPRSARRARHSPEVLAPLGFANSFWRKPTLPLHHASLISAFLTRASLLRAAQDVDELRLVVRRDPDLLAEVRAARAQDRIDRYRAAEPRRCLDRLKDPHVL